MLRVQTEISWSHGTTRGNVHPGTAQQGDGPTIDFKCSPRLLFFAPYIFIEVFTTKAALEFSEVTGRISFLKGLFL